MLRGILAGAALLLASACSSRPPDESNYLNEIAAARAAKDSALRAATAPITAETRDKFLPLVYFPIDPAFAVPASFTENPPGARQRVEMQTSTHQPRQMERIGTLAFTLQGQLLHLAAYHEVGDSSDRLFVPFTDLTSGKETYQAGRYLDIARSRTGVYVVDFNQAYNPYCYYNPTYDCPYPPRENRLAVAIRAGEKIVGSRQRTTVEGRETE
jgi:uncharacterized protein (DUF1684 family)